MTRRTQHLTDVWSAADRISKRFGPPGRPLSHTEVLELVADAVRGVAGPDRAIFALTARGPDPTLDDCLDGLAQIDSARREIDLAEMRIIEHARMLGATWEQIGQVLGYDAHGARQGASGRFRVLAAQYPTCLASYENAGEQPTCPGDPFCRAGHRCDIHRGGKRA